MFLVNNTFSRVPYEFKGSVLLAESSYMILKSEESGRLYLE